jgi:hypothetical protein
MQLSTWEPVVRGPDLTIAEIAGRQHGIVARRQLMDLGLGKTAIGGAVQRGYLLLSTAASTRWDTGS